MIYSRIAVGTYLHIVSLVELQRDLMGVVENPFLIKRES
jgi:hypothetical protein